MKLRVLKPGLRTAPAPLDSLRNVSAPSDSWRNWYTFSRWRKIRDRQLQREPVCRFCEAQGRTELATVADHIRPHRGDPELFWRGRLQSLCKPCHDSLKKLQENGKPVRITGADGWPVSLEPEPQPGKPREWTVY